MTKKTLFLLATILFCGFVFFSYFVAKETFQQIDFDVTVKTQDRLSHQFDLPFSYISLLGSVEVVGIITFLLWIFLVFKKYFYTALSLILLPFGLALEVFGKVFVLHPGPPKMFFRGVLEYELPSHYVPTAYAYPSGHVLRLTFLIVFLSVFCLFKLPFSKQILIQPLLIAFIGVVCISRVYLGEHWLSDVIGGLLLGTSLGIFSALTIPTNKSKSLISSS